MLTGELLRVRRQGGEIVPRYLAAATRRRLEPVAAELVRIVEQGQGWRREELQTAWDEIPHRPADRLVVAGLRKLLTDRCEFTIPEGPDPAELREALFPRAAAIRRALGPRERFDADEVVQAVAAEFGMTAAQFRERLFADRRDRERLVHFRPVDPGTLLCRYDLGLAQAVLLRATKVTVWVQDETPACLRQLFAAARFRGLLHQLYRGADGHYRIELDGPLSLFGSSKRYGLELALFLPAVLRCRRWRLEAQLLWGRSKDARRFSLTPAQGLDLPGSVREPGTPTAVTELLERFRSLDTHWQVRPNQEVFALAGEAVCIPDLVFESRETGELVYLEVFGFWSRHAVWQRIETIRRGFPARVILAVGKQLRVSEEALGDQDAGELYVYRTKMSAQALLARLDGEEA